MTATITCDAPNCSTTFASTTLSHEHYHLVRAFLEQETHFHACSIGCLSDLANSQASLAKDPYANTTPATDLGDPGTKLRWAKAAIGLSIDNPSDTDAYQSLLDEKGVVVDRSQLVKVRDALGTVIAEMEATEGSETDVGHEHEHDR